MSLTHAMSLILLLVLAGSLYAPAFRPPVKIMLPIRFKSDGCTIAGGIYGWFGRHPPWEWWCIHVHDPAYFRGGPWHQRVKEDFDLAVIIWRCGSWHRVEAVAVFLFLLFLGGYSWPWPHYRWGGAALL